MTKNIYDTSIKEALVASMGEFIDNIKILTSVMNYNVFVPVPKAENNTQYLVCMNRNSHANAKGFISSGGLTVLEGSQVSEHMSPAFNDNNYCKLRQQLENDGTISSGIFQHDYEFSSPSAAEAVILGRSSNGNVDMENRERYKIKGHLAHNNTLLLYH